MGQILWLHVQTSGSSEIGCRTWSWTLNSRAFQSLSMLGYNVHIKGSIRRAVRPRVISSVICGDLFPENKPTRQKYTLMLLKLPTELLFWICKCLPKDHLLNLCLVCRGTHSVFTEALFRCLVSDKVPPLFRAVRAQRLDIAALFIQKYHVNINSEYAGKNALLLAIELRYPQAVDLVLRYKPDVRYSEVEAHCPLQSSAGILL
jgi:hypothetical protein